MSNSISQSFGRTFFEATQIPTYLISASGGISLYFSNVSEACDLVRRNSTIIDCFKHIISEREEQTPLLLEFDQSIMFIAVPCCKTSGSFWLLGPVAHLSFQEEKIPILINRYHIPDTAQEEFSYYFRCQILHQPKKMFIGVANLVYFHEWDGPPIYQARDTSFPSISENFNRAYISERIFSSDTNAWFLPAKEYGRLIRNIKRGDTFSAIRHLESAVVEIEKYIPDHLHRIDTYLPNARKYFDPLADARLTLLGMVSRIAAEVVNSGFDEEESWLIWFFYADKALRATSIEAIGSLVKQMVTDYAERFGSYTIDTTDPMVGKCIQYIRHNLFDDFSIASIAAHLGLSQRQLATHFKEFTGISLNTFINGEKISASKLLLTHTNYSLVEISDILRFNSQSYFSSLFKKSTGFTPKAYRDKFKD